MPAPTSPTRAATTAPFPAGPSISPGGESVPPRVAQLPRWVVGSVVATGLAVLVLATTADGAALLQAPPGRPLGSPPGPLGSPSSTTSVGVAASATPDPITPIDVPWLRPLVLSLLVVVAVIMVTGTVVALVHVARRLWEDRWQAPDVLHAMDAQPVDVELTAQRDAVTDAADQMREALRAGTPRNAVVQCWLLLIAALERHGVTPDPARSPTELARDALNHVSTDRDAVAELTALFLEARFSEHVIGEDARTRAETALRRVVDALRSEPAST